VTHGCIIATIEILHRAHGNFIGSSLTCTAL